MHECYPGSLWRNSCTNVIPGIVASEAILALMLSQTIVEQCRPTIPLGRLCSNVIRGPFLAQQWAPTMTDESCGQTEERTDMANP